MILQFATRSSILLSNALLAAAVVLSSSVSAAAQSTDADTGRNLAAACANCHGTNGNSVDDIATLAGMPANGLVQKMKEFGAGAAPATVMREIANGYSERQIALIAAWFAAQKAASPTGIDKLGTRQP
jgi:cytochrome c553